MATPQQTLNTPYVPAQTAGGVGSVTPGSQGVPVAATNTPVIPPSSRVTSPPLPYAGAPVPPQSIPVVPQKRSTNYVWVVLIVLLVVVVLGIGGVTTYYFLSPKNEIVIDNQSPGKTIHVRKLHLVKPGFLGIKNVSGTTGSLFIASTPYLEADEYDNFDLPLFGTQELLSGDTLYGVILEDVNHNKQRDENTPPMKDMFGREVRVYFKVP